MCSRGQCGRARWGRGRVTGRGEVGASGAGPWGAGVRVTGRGRVRAEGAVPEVGAEDAELEGSDAEST